jgi:ABC-2 type transport system ATP-binding protein
MTEATSHRLRDVTSAASSGAASEAPPEPVVSIRQLLVRYGQQRVLDDVGLAISAGEVYALLGRNGVGKTSLLRCLLGQQKPASGDIEVFGRDAWRERTALMARVAVVPERPEVPPEVPVARAARFVASLRPAFDHDGFQARIERAGVDPRRRFGELSRGQQTLVGLALALASRPELLVLDDPTLGLDAAARREVLREVVEVLGDERLTVLLTSHDLRGVEQIATRVGFLASGRLVLDLPLDELKARFRRLLVQRGAPSAVAAQAGRVLWERELAWARELVVQLGPPGDFSGSELDADGMESLEMDLEEIFLAVCEPAGSTRGAEVAS